jgi:hypothetical protein
VPDLRQPGIYAQPPLHPMWEGYTMTLQELSRCYEEAAAPLRARLHQLRQRLSSETDPEEIFHIKRRIAELTPMLTEMNELAELTAHYYDRGYYRNEKYTL